MANLKESLLRVFIPLSMCVFSATLHAQNDEHAKSTALFKALMEKVSVYRYEGQLAADSVLTIDPTNAYVLQQKAIPYLKGGDFASWIKIIDKAVQYNPKRYLAYRGFCKAIFVKDYEGALLDFEEIQRLKPNMPVYEMDHSMEYFRSLCYLEMGNLDSARFFMEKSLKWQLDNRTIEWTHYGDLFYMGVIYYALNDFSKAQYYIDASLKNYAQFPDAHYYKALILNKLGKGGEALDHLAQIEDAWKKRYRMNEDNEYYANYPKQIGQIEVNDLRAVLTGKN